MGSVMKLSRSLLAWGYGKPEGKKMGYSPSERQFEWKKLLSCVVCCFRDQMLPSLRGFTETCFFFLVCAGEVLNLPSTLIKSSQFLSVSQSLSLSFSLWLSDSLSLSLCLSLSLSAYLCVHVRVYVYVLVYVYTHIWKKRETERERVRGGLTYAIF